MGSGRYNEQFTEICQALQVSELDLLHLPANPEFCFPEVQDQTESACICKCLLPVFESGTCCRI